MEWIHSVIFNSSGWRSGLTVWLIFSYHTLISLLWNGHHWNATAHLSIVVNHVHPMSIHFLITPFPADNTPVSGFLNTTLSSLWSNGLYSHQISIQQSIFGIHRNIHQKIQWCEPTNLQPSSKGRRAQTSTISFNFQHKFLYNVIKNLNLDNNSVKKIILTCCSVIFNIFHSVGAQISADTCCFYRSWGKREDKRLRASHTLHPLEPMCKNSYRF